MRYLKRYENIKSFDFQEDWEEEDNVNDVFKIGDYVTVIKLPDAPHWLRSDERVHPVTFSSDKRTFKIVDYPRSFNGRMLWSTDGYGDNKESGRYGIPGDCFRHSTPEEIIDYKEKFENVNENTKSFDFVQDWEEEEPPQKVDERLIWKKSKIFYRFLKEWILLDKWITNTNNPECGGTGVSNFLSKNIWGHSGDQEKHFIFNAFTWSSTLEGWKFWDNMNKEYLRFLKENKHLKEQFEFIEDFEEEDTDKLNIGDRIRTKNDIYFWYPNFSSNDGWVRYHGGGFVTIKNKKDSNDITPEDYSSNLRDYELPPKGIGILYQLEGKWPWFKINPEDIELTKNESVDFDFEEDFEEDEKIPSIYKVIKDIDETFYNFLIENDVIDEWIYNIETLDYSIKTMSSRYRTVESFLNNHQQSQYIGFAFPWKESIEGSDFWDNIWVKWEDYREVNESISFQEDWEDEEPSKPLNIKDCYRGQKVVCIKDSMNTHSRVTTIGNRIYVRFITEKPYLPIKKGDIKVVKDKSPNLIWFEDTPSGWGGYLPENFSKV